MKKFRYQSIISEIIREENNLIDIINRIREYDERFPKIDELMFVNDIMVDYSITRDCAIELIQFVRKKHL